MRSVSVPTGRAKMDSKEKAMKIKMLQNILEERLSPMLPESIFTSETTWLRPWTFSALDSRVTS